MTDETPDVDPLALIEVVSGTPTAEDIAAAKAVVAGMLREGGAVESSSGPDRWAASAREGRAALEQGIQTWGDHAL
jgi:hypothetical protein